MKKTKQQLSDPAEGSMKLHLVTLTNLRGEWANTLAVDCWEN
jgi:hypothetical protein